MGWSSTHDCHVFTLQSKHPFLTLKTLQATEDSCSFKVKGFTVKLRIVEREQNKLVKISGDDEGTAAPIDFTFWLQLHQVSDNDTRIRLVLHAELNMMMRMMIGGKIQGGLDKAVEVLATAFNQLP